MNNLTEVVGRAVERPYDIPLNVAIWISFKPIIKIYLSIGAGFLLTKYRILTPELSKGISRLVLLIFMPCLLFNNIVSQIKDTDIKLLGVIVFSGFIYYIIGLGWGLIVYLVAPIPRAWFGGLLFCCMLNNCSDLPLAYVQTIGKSPFLPANAAARGQSYCVLIVIIFIMFCFNFGGTRLVEWDFTRDDPHGNEPTVPLISWESSMRMFRWMTGRQTDEDREIAHLQKEKHIKEHEERDEIKAKKLEAKSSDSSSNDHHSTDLEAQASHDVSSEHPVVPYNELDHRSYLAVSASPQENNARDSSAHLSIISQAQHERPFGSTDIYYSHRRYSNSSDERNDTNDAFRAEEEIPTEYENLNRVSSRQDHIPAGFRNLSRHMSRQSESGNSKSRKPPNVFQRHWKNFKRSWFKFKAKNKVTTYICNFCEDIFLPQMLALISGIIIAMIPWVRRVFVKGQNIKHFHDAPDKNPPLDFLMDFLSFFAAAQVPLGLMLLGGTMASLKAGKMVKGFWKTLVLIVVFKLGILPIIACGWIHRIREIGWISKTDAMTPIVLAVASGTPSATVQIYLTLAWMDPTKENPILNCLAISLMAQYVLLPISMTILMTYTVMHWV